jgi:hypothetical protein
LPRPIVDERVELLSIVFRLAGSEEYSLDDNKIYVRKIHAHFDKYKNHQLIDFARRLRDSSGIGYDAVMFMAVCLNKAPGFEPLVPFATKTPEGRWKPSDADKFVHLLRIFYKEAKCENFFSKNISVYESAVASFDTVFRHFDVEWFKKYYGVSPNEEFHIVLGLGNGGNNYGPHIALPGSTKKVYAIIGAQDFNKKGVPTFFQSAYLPLLIHEFSHSFVNYLIEKYEKTFATSGQIIYAVERIKMQRQAYATWQTMMSEALVRASVIRYFSSHGFDSMSTSKLVKEELANGFVWMEQLVNILGEYEKSRYSFPSLDIFMPKLNEFYDTVARNIEEYELSYTRLCGKLVKTDPIVELDSSVYSQLTELKFLFDKPLDGVRYFFGPTKKGLNHYPENVTFAFDSTNTVLIMNMKLKPKTEYEINMIGRMMRTSDGYAVQGSVIRFKTK